MNIFQAANGAATFLILSAIVAGLAKPLETTRASPLGYLLTHLPIVYLAFFIVIFRIKTLFDDHKHFAELYQDKNNFRYVGFVLAVLSWMFWGLAAYLVAFTMRASELMALSILISTLWVAVHLLEIRFDRERRSTEVVTSILRERWVLVNVCYVILLVAHIGWFRPVIQPGATMPLLILLGLLFYDIVTSRSFRDVATPN